MLYISTTSITNNKNLFNVLERYNKLGIKNIELGSVHNYISDFKPLFKFQKDNDVNFIIHGFFPPLKEKRLMINLSSLNKRIREESKKFIKNVIGFCRKINCTQYTFHSGYLSEIDENLKIISKKYDYDKVFLQLKKSLLWLSDYIKNYDIKMGIETMHSDLENKGFMVHPDEFVKLFNEINIRNIGILFDTGHMKVNSVLLNFDFRKSVEKLKRYIIALHLQDNSGKGKDEHSPIKNNNILDCFGKEFLKDKYLTLEGQNNWTEKDILDSKKIVEKYLE